jgi:predicted MFS family arabinose efflux permease
MNVKRLIPVLGLAGFIVMADNWVVSPLLPAIARSFHTDPARAGILIAAYMLPFGLFQLVFGPLADRYGKLRVIGITLVFFTGATALCGLGVGLGDLTLYRALTGLFAAATMPVSLALIGDLVPMEQRQQAIAGFMGIAFLGQAASMTIGGSIAYVSSWRGVFFVYGAMAAVITVVLLASTRQARGQLRGDPSSEFFAPYGRLLRHRASRRTYLVVFVEGILILGSFSYLGSDAAHALHLNTLGIGLLMAAFGVGVIGGSRAAGRLAASLGRARLVAIALVTAAVADLFVAFGSGQMVLFALGALLLGLGFMLAHSSLLTSATQFAERARGTAMSLVAFCFMVGGSIGTLIGGRIVLGAGYPLLYAVLAAALVVLAAVSLITLRQPLPSAELAPSGARVADVAPAEALP